MFSFCPGIFESDIFGDGNSYVHRNMRHCRKKPLECPLSPRSNLPHSSMETCDMNFQPTVERKIPVKEC